MTNPVSRFFQDAVWQEAFEMDDGMKRALFWGTFLFVIPLCILLITSLFG